MFISQISLTVSHLPTSCSFFLSALSPLGYKYIGQEGNRSGFGIDQSDFFICQGLPGIKPGAAHLAFAAPSHAAVDSFFSAALKAGGRIHGQPALRDLQTRSYSAAVVDFDNNVIEAVYRDTEQDEYSMQSDSESLADEGRRVLTWQKGSAGLANASPSTNKNFLRSLATDIAIPAINTKPSLKEQKFDPSTTFIGTLLGAAAGAAIAYAVAQDDPETTMRELIPIPHSQKIYQAVVDPLAPRSTTSHRTLNSNGSTVSLRSAQCKHYRCIDTPGTPRQHTTLIKALIPHSEIPPSSLPLAAPARPGLRRSLCSEILTPHSPPSRPGNARSYSSSAKTVSKADYIPLPLSHTSSRYTSSQFRDDKPASSHSHRSRGNVTSRALSQAPKFDELGSIAPCESISQVGLERDKRSNQSRARSRHHDGHRNSRSQGQKGRCKHDEGESDSVSETSAFTLPVRGSRKVDGKKKSVVSDVVGQ